MLAVISAHDAYERGIAPVVGGYLDQPPKLLEAFEYIGAWKAERQAKSNRSAAKGGGGGRKKGGLIGG